MGVIGTIPRTHKINRNAVLGGRSLEKIIKLRSDEEAVLLYGSLDERLRFAEEKFKVKILVETLPP